MVDSVDEYLKKYREREEYQGNETKNTRAVGNDSFGSHSGRTLQTSQGSPKQKKGKYLTPKKVDSKVDTLNRRVHFSSLEGFDKVRFGVKYLLNRGMDVLDNLDVSEDQKEKLERITENIYQHLEGLSDNRQYLDEAASGYIRDSCSFQEKYEEASDLAARYFEELNEHKEFLSSVDRFSPEFYEAFQNYQKAKSLYFQAMKNKSTNYARRNSCIRSSGKMENLAQFNNSVEFDLEHMLVNNDELQAEAEVYHKIMRTIIHAVKDSTSTEEYHEKVGKCLEHYDSFNKELKAEYHKRISPKMNFND